MYDYLCEKVSATRLVLCPPSRDLMVRDCGGGGPGGGGGGLASGFLDIKKIVHHDLGVQVPDPQRFNFLTVA